MTIRLVEETEELASNVLATSLLVVHDTSGGGQNEVTELTRGEELGGPGLEVTELNGVAGVDNTALVKTAVQLDDDLAGAVVVNLLELANVACWKEEVSMECCENIKVAKYGKKKQKLVRSPPCICQYIGHLKVKRRGLIETFD